jgi:hypothetical protein
MYRLSYSRVLMRSSRTKGRALSPDDGPMLLNGSVGSAFIPVIRVMVLRIAPVTARGRSGRADS